MGRRARPEVDSEFGLSEQHQRRGKVPAGEEQQGSVGGPARRLREGLRYRDEHFVGAAAGEHRDEVLFAVARGAGAGDERKHGRAECRADAPRLTERFERAGMDAVAQKLDDNEKVGHYLAVWPPSMTTTEPVMKRESSEAR